MLIILEGVDGGGKTTLADELEKQLGFTRRYHCGPLYTHPLHAYEKLLDWYSPGQGDHVIVDRLHWGELIYGPLYRGKSKMDKAVWRHIEMFLNSRGAVMVNVTQPVDVLKTRLKSRGETFLKSEHVADVRQAFLDVAETSIIEHVVMTDGMGDAVETIIQGGTEAESNVSFLAEHKTYVGPSCPAILVLGDHSDVISEFNACFVPNKSSGGHYLLDNINPTHIGYVGMSAASDDDVEALWGGLLSPLVVSVGEESHEIAVELRIPHGRAPHPSQIRRSHHKSGLMYGQIVVEAALRRRDLSWWRP